MTEALIHPPRTIMEVFKMLPEGTLAEVIENTLYMSPTPVKQHQRILRKLSTQFDVFVTDHNLGEIFYAPFDVFLDEKSNAVQPDLLFISNANSKIIDEHQTVHGVPDLIIEVLSPGNKSHDMVTKRNLYEKFGVKEYWIVDPETMQASGFTLQNSVYVSLGGFSGKIQSKLLQHEFTF
jgi:Uma2 family endonuclease